MIEIPTDKSLLENNLNYHSRQMSCITEIYGNLRRNTTGQVNDPKLQKENLNVQYKNLSLAYDNAQQKILDLETQQKTDAIIIENSKQKLHLYDQLSNHDTTKLLKKINEFDISDGEQLLTEWARELTQLQAISQQLLNENSILKQQSHQFLDLNGKLSEDLQQTFQELSDKSDEVVERENQIEELIDYIEQIKSQSLEKDDQKQFLMNELQTQKDNYLSLESLCSKKTQDKKLLKSIIETERKNLLLELNHRNQDFDVMKVKCQEQQLNETSLKSECQQLKLQLLESKANQELLNSNTMIKSEKERDALQTNLQRVYAELSQARSEVRFLKEAATQSGSELNQVKRELDQIEKLNQNHKKALDDQYKSLLQNHQEQKLRFETLKNYSEQQEHKILDLEEVNQTKINELEKIVDQFEQHCNQLQKELQSYSEIINQYQESIQVVVQLLQLENLESMDDFSMKVEKSIQGMLIQYNDYGKLNESLLKANKIVQKLKKDNERLSKDMSKLQCNDLVQVKELQQQLKEVNDQNANFHGYIEQMTKQLDHEHQLKQEIVVELQRQENMSQVLSIIMDRASKCLGGDYGQLFQELEDVYRQKLNNKVDTKMLDARISALNGELDCLDSLDKKRINMIQQLEKMNSQLKNEVQILKNDIDLKEFQRRNGEFNSQNTTQTYRMTLRRQHDESSEKNTNKDYFVQSSASKRIMLQTNTGTQSSLIKNLSYQFKSFE